LSGVGGWRWFIFRVLWSWYVGGIACWVWVGLFVAIDLRTGGVESFLDGCKFRWGLERFRCLLLTACWIVRDARIG